LRSSKEGFWVNFRGVWGGVWWMGEKEKNGEGG